MANFNYHGTSTALNIKNMVLPPSQTNIKREEWRKKYNNQIFFTNSLLSARKFAMKACSKYGGSPIIYIVKPIGNIWRRKSAEYLADKALIIDVIT